MRRLDQLQLNQRFRQLPEDLLRPTPITPQASIKLASFNPDAAKWLNLADDPAEHPKLAQWLNGEFQFAEQQTVATRYSGHQFGHYVPQLGDGRALLFGEIDSTDNEWIEMQLKGGGPTPFSRQGDGRAVLRSTIREYLCSEAMHALGIPTTRALCIAHSTSEVYREQIETGALLLRLAPSHIRFGHFEICFYNDEQENSRELADFVIQHHLPQMADAEKPYVELLKHAVNQTAILMAHWQSVGFSHGVMNTDNMSILGLTIDYGPFGFMEGFEPGYICNHTDHQGRYAFNRQPDIAYWNLTALAQAMTNLISVEEAKQALSSYGSCFEANYLELMAQKLGLDKNNLQLPTIINQLFANMARDKTDYSRLFRALCMLDQNQPELPSELITPHDGWQQWLTLYSNTLMQQNIDQPTRQQNMLARNPKYILRNYMAQEAIEAAEKGDFSLVDALLHLLQTPFDEHPQWQRYAESPPEWSQQISVSCSS